MPLKRVFLQFALFLLCFGTLSAATDNRTVWYVLQGATGGNGTLESPLGSVMEINDCTGPGDTIKILPSEEPLNGLITLKEGQTLKGIGPCVTQLNEGNYDTVAHAQVTNTTMGQGAIQLGDNAKVINVHVRDVAGSGFQPLSTASISGTVSGEITLKDVLITHSGDASTTRGIFATFDGSAEVLLRDVIVKKLEDPVNPSPEEWFNEGIRLISSSTNGGVNVRLTCVEVQNVGGFGGPPGGFQQASWGGIRLFQQSAEFLKISTQYTKTTNVVGDHFLISDFFGTGSGEITADVSYHQSNNSSQARSAMITLFGAFAPIRFGADFGFETLALAAPVNLTVRNSLFTNGIGPGVGILLGDVTASLDLGTESDPGNNAIFNNVTGSEFTDFLLEDNGLKFLAAQGGFNLINQGTSGAEDNIGSYVNLYLDGFDSQQLCAEGNFWGTGVGPAGPGPCLELELFETGEANDIEMQQNNPGDFSPSDPWTCIIFNSFSSFTEFMQQPKSGNALQKNPYE